MTSGKAINTAHIVLAVIFAAGLAVGTFFDEPIARAVYAPDSVFAYIMTVLGQYIFFASFGTFAGALCRQAAVCKTVSPKKRVFCCVFCGYLTVSTSTIGAAAVMHYECLGALFPGVDFSFFFLLIFGLLTMFPLFFVGYAAGKKEYDPELKNTLIRILLFITVTALFIGLLKLFFTRPRVRVTLLGYGIEGIYPWFRAIGKTPYYEAGIHDFGLVSNEFRSFPSGHSTMSVASIYIFPALAYAISKLKKREWLLFAVGLIYGLAVMLSRMLLGAHYLSDVSAGALIAVGMSFAFTNIKFKRRSR